MLNNAQTMLNNAQQCLTKNGDAKRKQLSLFSRWTPGTILPAPGQTVLLVYEREDGTASDIIISTPIHRDDKDYPVVNGKPFIRPVLWWMELPGHPVNK